MTVMDDYLDSPLDSEDVFPCKGCGDILEEGKAFELAGNRWHLNCFRCNTCGTLLDSDANLLLLGDGSLICNNCTYSCSACGNKIEDLAILTGDQAFCATCFRCRNCKRKIENLRYARTSQGIFCMSCHESLMARRKKKSRAAAAQAKAREKDGSPMITDKSLPALPPNAIPPGAFSNDMVAPAPDSDTPTELSPRPRPAYTRNDSSSRSSSRPDRSPERTSDSTRDGGLSVPAPNYRNNRNSTITGPVDISAGGDGDAFFIPVALDPSPAPSLTPRSTSDTFADQAKTGKENDYFAASKPSDKPEPQSSTPHIAFQDKGRQTSSDYDSSATPAKPPSRKLSKSSRAEKNAQAKAAQMAGDEGRKLSNGRADDFKLQEAPKSKKLVSSRSNSQSNIPVGNGTPKAPNGMLRREKEKSDSPPMLGVADQAGTPRSSQDSRFRDEDDIRPSLDSMASGRPSAGESRAIHRKELPTSTPTPRNVGRRTLTKAATSEDLAPPPRPGLADHKMSDTYMQPRAPPQPPSHTPGKESVSSETASPKNGPSPSLPRWSAGGDFSMDEDMARILGTDEGSSSILRRVSNAVRHGRNNSAETSGNHHSKAGHNRSLSESTRLTASPRWPKTPIAEGSPNGDSHDISSPISLSGGAQDDPAFLKRQLRNSEQRVAELERQFHTERDLKSLNKKLIEKRKTVSVLDTQTEIMIRQLEVLAGYVERAKETKQPVDPRDLEDSAIKDFVQKLDRVKQSMAATIEQLHGERDELVEEKNKAVADRDRALLEFEQLSSKNAQLADMNNDLTHQIQERFKSHSDVRSPSGLGIYSVHRGPAHSSGNLDSASIQTGQATLISTDVDEPVVESGPTVVNIRKGQVRKFNWKKGSKTVAQNLTKGVNRAVGAFQQQGSDRERGQFQGLTGDSIGLPYNMTVAQVDSPAALAPNGQNLATGQGMGQGMGQGLGQNLGQNRMPSDNGRPGFGFFGKKGAPMPKSASSTAVSTPQIPEAPSTLFGSDLVERADYERRQIPSVVTRCIEEVELRGMDTEGIYRKTGGNSLVKVIQEGFDKQDDYDISDPGLDITAVTSVLKQYFRKLPVPLLTFDAYERVLESNAVTNEAERCAHLRKTVNMLPPKHRDCLEFLMFHLARVAGRERENLMSPKNLAVVFAPTIMRDHSLEKEMSDMHAKNGAVQFVIENSHSIFSEA